MFSHDQVLALMRERVHHPAGMRELLQVLKVPKDDRTSFKRHVKSLVASGDLIQIRGDRFGLPEKMDLYVGRLQAHPAGYGFVAPERPLDSGGGDIDAPGVDTEIIIRTFGIPDAHPADAIAEAVRLGTTVSERDIRGRSDFRDLLTVTIDGEHARDFDDAITLEQLRNGSFWLGVHIADVSHYVQDGSALDREAYDRGTSEYFPERAVHMFPSELATGLCSLNPHVDRLVQSCFMEVDRRGQVVRHEFHDGVIHSSERTTYTAVNGILTDRDPELIKRYQPLVP